MNLNDCEKAHIFDKYVETLCNNQKGKGGVIQQYNSDGKTTIQFGDQIFSLKASFQPSSFIKVQINLANLSVSNKTKNYHK